MSITPASFDRLVAELEHNSKKSPGSHKTRVALLALLGYAYPLAFIAFSAVLSAFLLYTMVVQHKPNSVIGWLIGSLILLDSVLVRCLWVRSSPPTGYQLTARDAAPLFRMINEVRAAVKGPRVDVVLLSEEFNASVVQSPRFGIFGGYKNYLVLGLPLLQAFSADEFRFILAHEFGHLSGAHGRMGSWIYRVRITYARISESMRRRAPRGAFIFTKFFEWYLPLFTAYSCVLARNHEYEADKSGAALVGSEKAADALINLKLYGAYYYEVYRPGLAKQIEESPEPPAFYKKLQQAFRECSTHPQIEEYLQQALRRETDSEDSHPSLRDRLSALGQQPHIPVMSDSSAAQVYFGKGLPQILDIFDRKWQERVAGNWRKKHEEVLNSRTILERLESKVQREPLTVEEAWERAALVEEFHGSEAAYPLYQEVLQSSPRHPASLLVVGRIQLERGEREGIPLIETAMAADSDLILSGTEAIYHFLMDRGERVTAQKYRKMASDHANVLESQRRERMRVKGSDRYVPHGLSREVIEDLARQLSKFSDVGEAFIARKELPYGDKAKVYTLCIKPYCPWYLPRLNTSARGLLDRLLESIDPPVSTVIVISNVGSNGVVNSLNDVRGLSRTSHQDNIRETAKKVRNVPGAEVYNRRN